MRKILLLFFSTFSLLGHGQMLPLFPIPELEHYPNPYASQNQMQVINDTLVYCLRSGGLEILNVNSQQTNYYWRNHFQAQCILKDTGDSYIYLRDQGKYVGVYNSALQRHENIWPDSLIAKYNQVRDISQAPSGKIWATVYSSFPNKAAGLYDGSAWTFFPHQNIMSHILAVNDTMAYVHSYIFYTLHNGIYDTLYTLPSGSYFRDWTLDPAGNVWIAANSTLIRLQGKTATVYNTSNTPIGTDEFISVKAGTNGHIWVGGKKKLLEFDGSSWQTRALPSPATTVEAFALNSQDLPYVAADNYSTHSLYMFNGSSWSNVPFPFMPITNLKVMGAGSTSSGYGYFATDQGYFRIDLHSFSVSDFTDTSKTKYADDVTCFATENGPAFGSHQGTGMINGFNDAILPNKKVNTMDYYNGSYYIGTDSGLVIYNGIIHTILNTNNSPLPSDKITFVTTGNHNYCSPSNTLYIGTDKGLATYTNTQWKVYDTSNVALTGFHVSCIYRHCWDTVVYVTTAGNGLITLYPSGNYDLYNTSNGKLLDDTLFYVAFAELASCGQFIIAGTANHGIAYSFLYQNPQFQYDTVAWNPNQPFHRSEQEFSSFPTFYGVNTDNGLFYLTPCGPVEENKNDASGLSWTQSGSQLILWAPDEFTGTGKVSITNMLGQTILEREVNSKKTTLDAAGIPAGVYVLRLNSQNKTWISKALISK